MRLTLSLSCFVLSFVNLYFAITHLSLFSAGVFVYCFIVATGILALYFIEEGR